MGTWVTGLWRWRYTTVVSSDPAELKARLDALVEAGWEVMRTDTTQPEDRGPQFSAWLRIPEVYLAE